MNHITKSSHRPTEGALSRRGFLEIASASGIGTVAAGVIPVEKATAAPAPDGTPEQIHLTWGHDPATEVVISWSTPVQATHPRVRFREEGQPWHTAHGIQRTYTDGINGTVVFNYHARLHGLKPGVTYHYEVTGDNDGKAASPFTATFQTAPHGHKAFRWTSYGDLATPNTQWTLSYPQSKFAVDAVERFQPLFHLLNGDLCYANLNPMHQPDVWRDFGNNNQRSAANRPWMPCLGNHEIEFHNGDHGYASYLARYTLPDNGTKFTGYWYSFRVGSALFISLDGDDVVYQDAGGFVAGPAPLEPLASTGHPPIKPGTSFYNRGYSNGEQTRWLEKTLHAASQDHGIDWIIVQMHQDALSTSKIGNGSDKGIREQWLPLFDRYGVDLVLCGHDHDYERSFPIHGCNHGTGADAATGAPVDTLQPRPVVTSDPANGTFDAGHGAIHLILGGGGTNAPLDVFGEDPKNGLPQARIFTKPNRPVPGQAANTFVRPGPDAVEDAIWSAKRDTGTGYGIGVFDLDPGTAGGKTTITMNYYHAPGADKTPNPTYELFETIVLSKQRRG